MGKLTDYMENELLDHVLKVGAWSRPANLYLALCTADPGEGATGANITEPSGGGYARVACDDWDVANARATANSKLIDFGTSSGDWGVITHFAIVDSDSGAGNVIAYGEVSPNKEVSNGESCSVAIGDLDVSFNSGGMSNYFANEILDHVFPNAEYSQPTSIFVALTTAAVVDADNGSSISEPGENYARKEVNDWDASVNGISDNTTLCDFVQATGNWGTLSNFALCTHPTTGDVLFFGSLTTLVYIGENDTARIPAGNMDITLD